MAEAGVHIAGAGLSGLAAALTLAKTGKRVALYEAAGQAGGRCRSYQDAVLGMEIDNGNHLVLSGNRDTMRYADMLGTRSQLTGPEQAEFAFVDISKSERWLLRPNAGRLPWWIFSPDRRAPGTRAMDYLSFGRLMFAGKGARIADVMPCSGRLYDVLWRPILLAALNTEPGEASASLAGAVVRESLALGGKACRPLIAAQGLSSAFVNPALTQLAATGAAVQFGQRLKRVVFEGGRVTGLDFGDQQVEIGPGESVILAVPSWVASELVPGLTVPGAQRAIINGHFRFEAPRGTAAMLGVVGGTAEWIFAFPGRLSITVSGADRLLEYSREELAAMFWADIQAALGISQPMPAWQVLKEKRATFAAVPEENAKRPVARTRWQNLFLAGDYTATGLPATIEGAIRSGFLAARLAGSGLMD